MSGHGQLMDGVYRYQRHIYDLTRKYYLLGRDGLIADLNPPAGGAVLEIGCGTGRNLIAVGKAWPKARLYGVDISEAMLDTARASVARAGMADRVTLAQGDACGFDPQALFGRATAAGHADRPHECLSAAGPSGQRLRPSSGQHQYFGGRPAGEESRASLAGQPCGQARGLPADLLADELVKKERISKKNCVVYYFVFRFGKVVWIKIIEFVVSWYILRITCY